jgi:hypothetical protein
MNNKLLSVIVFLLLITVTISAREDINPFKDLEEGAILSGEAEFGDKFGLPMEDAVLNGFGMLGDEKSFTIFFNKEGEYLKLKIDGQWVTYGGFKERTSEEYTPEGPFLEFYTGETKIKAANFTTAEDWTYRVGSHDLSLKSGSKVRIKDDQLTEGTQLTLSKASVLTIRNHELNLPEGTKVKIEKNRVIIEPPEGQKIETPKQLKAGEKVIFEYRTDDSFILPNGDSFKGLSGQTGVLSFDTEKQMFSVMQAQVGTLEIGKLEAMRPVYLFFDDGELHKDFNGDYISLGNAQNNYKISMGSGGDEGTSVKFLPGNKYGGLEIGEKDNFIIEPRDRGYLTIENRAKSKMVPKLTTYGAYSIISGTQAFRYNENQKTPEMVPNIKKDGRLTFEGASSTPLQVSSLDRQGNKLWKWDIFIGDDDEKISIADSSTDWNRHGAYMAKDGAIMSPYVAFHKLTSEQQKAFAKLNDQQQLFYIKNADKLEGQFTGNFASLQRALEYEFETAADETGAMQILSQNAQVSKQGSLTKVEFSSSSSFRIKTNRGETREYKGIQGTINFDQFGEPVTADFTAAQTARLKFGNEEITLPKGTRFILQDGKAQVTVPDNEKIPVPKQTSSGRRAGIEYAFSYASGKAITLDNGDVIRNMQARTVSQQGNLRQFEIKTTIYYQDGKVFTQDKQVMVGQLELNNPSGQRVYIDLSGKPNDRYNSAYISLNKATKTLVLGNNGDQDGPTVVFRKDNPYGMYIQDKDYASIQLLADERGDSHVILQDRLNQGLVPFATATGEFSMIQDNKRFYYSNQNGNIMFQKQVADSLKGTSTVPIEMQPMRIQADGTSVPVLANNQRLVVGNDIRWAVGTDPSYIEVLSDPYTVGRIVGGQGVKGSIYHGVSNRVLYNYPTLKNFERLYGIKVSSTKRFNSAEVKKLMDFAESLTPETRRAIKTIELSGSYSFFSGMASPNGKVLNSGTSLGLQVMFHESIHLRQLALDGWSTNSDFSRDWLAVSGPHRADQVSLPHKSTATRGFAWGYGTRGYRWERAGAVTEDKATYGNYIFDPAYWKSHLQTSDPYHKIYRAKLALLERDNFVRHRYIERIFSNAGLPSDQQSLARYIQEGKDQWRR